MSSYSSEVLADSPRAYFRCDESSGQIQDSSGNGNHTVTMGGGSSFTYSQAGPIASDPADTGIDFNASRMSTAIGTASLDLGDVFTLEAWIKLTTSGTEGGIVSKEVNAYYMRIDLDGTISLLKSNVAVIVNTTTSITDTTTWHHVVCTKNGSTVKQYIDGVDRTGTVTNATCTNVSTSLNIGSDTTVAEYADFLLDEVAVYPTALSSARVLAHYNAAADLPKFLPRMMVVS